MSTIDFWFSIGSTYTYLTVMRIGAVEQQKGITVRWRPFDVRSIMVEMNNIPFSTKPIKAAYMWRDLERRAEMYGIPWVSIPAYPLKHLEFANRVAIIGSQEGWCPQYVEATYRRWFLDGQEAGSEPNLSESLREIGQEPDRVLALAATEQTKKALEEETDIARSLGVFGAPTFAVGTEIFWGDDRLEDAIRWQRYESLRSSA